MLVRVFTFSIISTLISLILIPLIIKFCKFYSLYDTVNARKIHSGNIPRLGGIAIALSFFITIIALFLFGNTLSLKNSLPLIITGILIFSFGILDDIIELRAIFKLIVQLAASTIVTANGFYFHQIFGLILPKYVGMAFTFCWIFGIINAYNLIDGLDGLCGILAFSTLITLGTILFGSYTEGSAVCFVLAASVLGFLIFNWPAPNAKIFMGDGGSQFLGFMIATIPLYSSKSDFEFNKFLIMLVIVSFPMIDTIAAIWRRIRDHRPIMSPDRLHLHHKLLNLGLTKTHALYMVISIQSLLCCTVILSTYLEKKIATISLVISYLFMIAFFSFIHFTNRAVLRKIRIENEHRNSGTIPEL